MTRVGRGMAARQFFGSPVAVALAVLGALAVAPFVAVGLAVAAVYRSTGLATDPAFLGGFGRLGYLAVAVPVVAIAALVWLPFGAGICHAVGRQVRGRPTNLRATASGVLDRAEPLARWTKTRVAVGPVADAILTEDDVHPGEIAVGCVGFVVPALLLDAPKLSTAVERANRVPPESPRDPTAYAPLVVTAVAAVGVVAWTIVSGGPSVAEALAVVVALLFAGGVLTAALDAAWRASVYAAADTSDGFRD